MKRLLKGRWLEESAKLVLFGLVASRALAPSSKLAAARWISEDTWIAGPAGTSDDACCRAMDWLLESRACSTLRSTCCSSTPAGACAGMLAQLAEMIKDTDSLGRDKRAGLRGVISTRPGFNRYLRTTSGGLLRTDARKIKAGENLGGNYLLRASDPHLPAEDVALGCRQLLEAERAVQGSARHPRPAQDRAATEDLPAHHRNPWPERTPAPRYTLPIQAAVRSRTSEPRFTDYRG